MISYIFATKPIISMIKSGRLRRAGHVASVEGMRSPYKIVFGIPKRESPQMGG
jgi:hypothetical protein